MKIRNQFRMENRVLGLTLVAKSSFLFLPNFVKTPSKPSQRTPWPPSYGSAQAFCAQAGRPPTRPLAVALLLATRPAAPPTVESEEGERRGKRRRKWVGFQKIKFNWKLNWWNLGDLGSKFRDGRATGEERWEREREREWCLFLSYCEINK